MREQLIHQVNLLFAETSGCDDIRQEILQNTLDHYDDLISQGVSPEAACSQALNSIGDLSELLGTERSTEIPSSPVSPAAPIKKANSKLHIAIAVALYILCPMPVILLENGIGVCLLLAMVALATGILIAGNQSNKVQEEKDSPEQRLNKSISNLISTIGLILYFVLSFSTGAWHITWLIFPIIGAVKGLVLACIDLKEAI